MDERTKRRRAKELHDQFQFAAFAIHYRINRRSGMCNTEAFAVAIAATSDQRTAEVLKQCPDAIERWVKVKRRVHYVESDFDYRLGTAGRVRVHQSDLACR